MQFVTTAGRLPLIVHAYANQDGTGVIAAVSKTTVCVWSCDNLTTVLNYQLCNKRCPHKPLNPRTALVDVNYSLHIQAHHCLNN